MDSEAKIRQVMLRVMFPERMGEIREIEEKAREYEVVGEGIPGLGEPFWRTDERVGSGTWDFIEYLKGERPPFTGKRWILKRRSV